MVILMMVDEYSPRPFHHVLCLFSIGSLFFGNWLLMTVFSHDSYKGCKVCNVVKSEKFPPDIQRVIQNDFGDLFIPVQSFPLSN